MDIKTIREILDKMPPRSDYEFRNFEIESQGNWHRQLRYALAQAEELHNQQQEISAEINLIQYELKAIRDKVELDIQTRIADAKINRLTRKITDIMHMKKQIDDWLAGWSVDECFEATDGFTSGESDNWGEVLGRALGVELLADKQASKDSMLRISLLPLNDYKKSVVIANQFANFLKKTAEQAENSMITPGAATIPQAATSIKTPVANQTDVDDQDDDDDDDLVIMSEKKKDKKKKDKKK